MINAHAYLAAVLFGIALCVPPAKPVFAATLPLIATAETCRAFADEVWAERHASFKALSACQKANRPTISYCPGFKSQHAWAPACCAAYAAERDAERVYNADLERVRECRHQAAATAKTKQQDEALLRLDEIVETVDDTQTLIDDTQELIADPLEFIRSKASPDVLDIALEDYGRGTLTGSRTEQLYESVWRLDAWGRRAAFRGVPPIVRGIQERSLRLLRAMAGRLIRDAQKASNLADRITSADGTRHGAASRSSAFVQAPRRSTGGGSNSACEIFADTAASSALMERDPNAWLALSVACTR